MSRPATLVAGGRAGVRATRRAGGSTASRGRPGRRAIVPTATILTSGVSVMHE